MQLDRPRFRQDLVAEPIDDAGTRFIDVMDPDSGNVFRFYEVEYSLACAMDGERDVTGIVQWAKEELGVAPSPTEVRSVIATLGELGYLDGAAAAAPVPVDDFMRPGVVVGQKRVHTPAPGIELGRAGASAPVATPKPAPAAHVELSPGVTAGRPARELPRSGGDIALGQSGRSDVSTDLSDQIGVGVEDVKAAVRASQVMKAVDVPPELAAAIADPKPLPRPRNTPPPMPVVKPPPDVKSVVSEPVPFAKAPTAPMPPVAKPVERPAPQPKAVTAAPAPTSYDKSKAPPAPAPQTSRALLVMLVIVVLAAIAFLVYRYVVKSSQSPTAEIPPVVHPKPPEPPPPPPVETEKLATTPETTDDLKPATTGQIEYLATDGAVKAGSVIATLAGAKPLSTEVGALAKDIDTRVKADLDQAQKDLATATAGGNKATIATATSHVADRQKTLDDKQSKLVAKQADLDKLEIKAPADGTIAAKAKVGAKVTPNDAILAFTRAAVRTVKFTKADGAVADARVLLVSKADGKKVSCIVTSAAPQAIAIECPADAAADGTVVTFGGLDPTPPPVVAPSGDLTTGSAAAVPSPAPVRTPPKAAPKKAPPAPPPPPPTPDPTPSPDPAAAGSAG